MMCIEYLICFPVYIDGLVQDFSNSIALAMELLQSCAKPSISCIWSHDCSLFSLFLLNIYVQNFDLLFLFYTRTPEHLPSQSCIQNGLPVWFSFTWHHYDDVRMGAIASQITSLTIVYSIFYSDADQRKHQSSESLAFVRGIHRGPVNCTNSQYRGKCFHLMTSSCVLGVTP